MYGDIFCRNLKFASYNKRTVGITPPKVSMKPSKKSTPPTNKSISINGDVKNSAVVIGDNTTIIQKFFNIFKSDSESMEHRNRRILLGHVENAWIKGVLDASLHGAALLDLGIKEDPEAVTKYPWAIKRESIDETLPAGTSMLEIFDSIGMGRSLLILGAPGSGKTTMLLELARQLIARAREDVTQPIPMVFNLASWTEKLSLADWLAQELNNLYSVPRKTAPDWVQGDKLLLLLDGLDEVRQDSRAKCVEAINAFRKEHGLTSLAVCSRNQDYADLNTKLSFAGAIEVQPLTQKQITEFFNRFGKEMAGIKQVLKKDSALREMAETPLFLSIMIMAYRDKQGVDIWVSKDENIQRKYLFDTYIERMFERPRSKSALFEKHDVLYWLSWLAKNMVGQNQVPYLLENMQPTWFGTKKQAGQYDLTVRLIVGLIFGLTVVLIFALVFDLVVGLLTGVIFGLLVGLLNLLMAKLVSKLNIELSKIFTVDLISWKWEKARKSLIRGLVFGLIMGLISGLWDRPVYGLIYCLMFVFIAGLMGGLSPQQVDQITYVGEKLIFTTKNFLSVFLFFWIIFGVIGGLLSGVAVGVFGGLFFGLLFGMRYGGVVLIRHYTLRYILARNNLLPWRLIPFLDHCVDLIFLRRVGGGYIFVHRLLMEHFAEMYVETPTSKGN